MLCVASCCSHEPQDDRSPKIFCRHTVSLIYRRHVHMAICALDKQLAFIRCYSFRLHFAKILAWNCLNNAMQFTEHHMYFEMRLQQERTNEVL